MPGCARLDWARGCGLVHLDTGGPRDLGPFIELRLDEGGGLFGAQAELLEAERLEPSLIAPRRKDGRHRPRRPLPARAIRSARARSAASVPCACQRFRAKSFWR